MSPEANEHKVGFLSMLLGTVRNLLTGKEVKARIRDGGVIRAGEGMIRVRQDF